MSNLEFAVGKRVVCIGKFSRRPLDEVDIAKPHKDCIYTIRQIIVSDGRVFLLLEEIVNPRCRDLKGRFDEPRWLSLGFRPVRETSIDCFTALLEKPPVRLREDA